MQNNGFTLAKFVKKCYFLLYIYELLLHNHNVELYLLGEVGILLYSVILFYYYHQYYLFEY